MKYVRLGQLYVPKPEPVLLPAFDQENASIVDLRPLIEKEFEVNTCLNRWRDRDYAKTQDPWRKPPSMIDPKYIL